MSSSADVVEYIERARKEASNGRSEEAHILYERALEIEPTNDVAMSENGFLYKSSKDYEAAMMWLESARAIKDSEKLQVAAAECFLYLGLTTDSIEVLVLALQTTPLLVSARVLMAIALNQLEQPGESLVHSEVALNLEPTNRTAQASKAISMCQLGLYTDSLALFVTSGQQQDSFLCFLFAEALYKQEQLDACIDQLNKLLEYDVNHLEALMLKSNALEDLGKLEEADAVMELLSRLTSDMPDPD